MNSIYRRGHIFWWRRIISLKGMFEPNITVRLSLRTSCAEQARRKAAVMEQVTPDTETPQPYTKWSDISPDQLRKIVHDIYRRKLRDYEKDQLNRPNIPTLHVAANLAYSRYYRFIARAGNLPSLTDDNIDKINALPIAQSERDWLTAVFQAHTYQPPISRSYLVQDLEAEGIKLCEGDFKKLLKLAAVAYARACVEASASMRAPIDDDEIFALPETFTGLFPEFQPRGFYASQNAGAANSNSKEQGAAPAEMAAVECAKEPAFATTNRSDAVIATPPTPAAPEKIKISELAAACIEAKTLSQEWEEDRGKEVATTARLFIGVNGDLPLDEINNTHLAAMMAAMHVLPRSYNQSKEDQTGGFQHVLARGRQLKHDLAHDPKKLKQKIGLSLATRNKHFSWLNGLFKWAADNTNFKVNADPTAQMKKPKARPDDGRQPWNTDELKTLLSGPIWTGCASAHRRFNAGSVVLRDAWYYAPLMIAVSCARSAEVVGLSLNEVHEDAAVPYIELLETDWRTLKSECGSRIIPISPHLIKLGFLDFVRQRRKEGRDLLFFELYTEKLKFSKVFYAKVFTPLRKLHFPNGTRKLRDGKDVDVHSVRTLGCNLLRKKFGEPYEMTYMIGHAPGSVLQADYFETPEPRELLPFVTVLDQLITHISP